MLVFIVTAALCRRKEDTMSFTFMENLPTPEELKERVPVFHESEEDCGELGTMKSAESSPENSINFS